MKKVLAFAGSNSKSSINKQLVAHSVSLLDTTDNQLVDLNDYPLPLFSIDLEKEKGFPVNALRFEKLIQEADGIIVSLAEHNGSYTAVFKNLFDWLSRIEANLWRNKPILLMSTSPGSRGGKGVLAAASERFPRHSAKIVARFSLPNFGDNFSNKITNPELNLDLQKCISIFQSSI